MTAKFREVFILVSSSHILAIPLVFYLIGETNLPNRYLFLAIYLTVVIAFSCSIAYACSAIHQQHRLSLENVIQDRQLQSNEHLEEIYRTIVNYSANCLFPYIPFSEFETLINNIRQFHNDGSIQGPILDNKELLQIDLRHYAWNIGERLGWTGRQRAEFIKLCFPREMGSSEVETIRRNLKTTRQCLIPLDKPDPGSFLFHDMPNQIVKPITTY